MTLFEPPEPPRDLPRWPAPAAPIGYPPPGFSYEGYPRHAAEPHAVARDGAGARRADIVVTVVVLAFALTGAAIGVATSVVLESATRAYYASTGSGYFETSTATHSMLFLAVSHIVLFVAAAAGSIVLLVMKRVAFWVPLVGGVIAAIIFWSIVVGYLTTDHTLQFVA